LKLLFVDDDPDLCELAKILIPREIKEASVDTVGSAKRALRMLKGGEYDAIIADYKLPDTDGLSVLEALRKKGIDIPFIILTGKSSEEVAIRALNLGANRYILKEPPAKKQFKELAKMVREEVRKSEASMKWRKIRSTEMKLLEKMLDGRIEKIDPEITIPSGETIVSYPEAEKIMKLSNTEVREALESLVSKGILDREFFDKFPKCPECGSTNVRFTTLCHNCGSPDIVRREALEHLKCGSVGTLDKFKDRSGKYVCYKCGEEMRAIGVDYSKVGKVYLCNECGEMFDSSNQLWKCNRCSRTFPVDEIDYLVVYSYKLNEEVKLRRSFKSWLKAQNRLVEVA